MRKPNKMPPHYYLDALFDFDPLTGGIWKKGVEHTDENVVGNVNQRTGYRTVHISGLNSPYLAHRLMFFWFHKVDPFNYYIDHKNCDKSDNRIENLRKVKRGSATQRKNKRKNCRYELNDEDGVGRNVSCVSDDEYNRIG